MKRSGLHAIAADHVFDGTAVRERTAVVVDGARIVDLVPTSDLPRTISIRELPDDAWLAPGFIDLQVNGGGTCCSTISRPWKAFAASQQRSENLEQPVCCRRS